MSTTGSSGSYSTTIAAGGAPRLLGLLGGDDRDRLADVADAVDREHGLVGELEAVASCARARRACVSTACTPGMRSAAAEVDRDDPRVRVRAADVCAPHIPRRGGRSRTRKRRDLGDGVVTDARASPTRPTLEPCGT